MCLQNVTDENSFLHKKIIFYKQISTKFKIKFNVLFRVKLQNWILSPNKHFAEYKPFNFYHNHNMASAIYDISTLKITLLP